MEIYEHLHDRPHYHLGSDQYNEPTGQNKIFEKIIQDLEQQLPEELHLKDENRKYSVTVRDDRHRIPLLKLL